MFPFSLMMTVWLVPVVTFFIGAGVFGLTRYLHG